MWCETIFCFFLNRLIFSLTLTLRLKCNERLFHLYFRLINALALSFGIYLKLMAELRHKKLSLFSCKSIMYVFDIKRK